MQALQATHTGHGALAAGFHTLNPCIGASSTNRIAPSHAARVFFLRAAGLGPSRAWVLPLAIIAAPGQTLLTKVPKKKARIGHMRPSRSAATEGSESFPGQDRQDFTMEFMSWCCGVF